MVLLGHYYNMKHGLPTSIIKLYSLKTREQHILMNDSDVYGLRDRKYSVVKF